MKLITEYREFGQDDVQCLSESASDGTGKKFYIEGVFLQAEVKNRNGRIYPLAIMEREVKRYTDVYVTRKRAFGELGHPDGPSINLDRVCHLIEKLYQDGSNFMGKAKILDTPNGKIVQAMLSDGAQLGVSSRGVGSLKASQGTDLVQDDFMLATAADIVADPSAPAAFVKGIMEGKEWVWNNGILKESTVAQIQNVMKPRKHIKGIGNRVISEDAAIEAFSVFLQKISK